MRLHRDWKKIMRHAWSMRLLALAGLLTGLEAALPFLPAFLSISTPVLAIATGLVVAGAFASRLVAQKEFKDAD